jgi:hypothetical protein
MDQIISQRVSAVFDCPAVYHDASPEFSSSPGNIEQGLDLRTNSVLDGFPAQTRTAKMPSAMTGLAESNRRA